MELSGNLTFPCLLAAWPSSEEEMEKQEGHLVILCSYRVIFLHWASLKNLVWKTSGLGEQSINDLDAKNDERKYI